MDKCSKTANLYLATLRALYLVHQHNHWTTKGSNYYGNHLLFQRIYETAQKSADAAAEKFIGILGEDSVDYSMQNQLINQIVSKYKSLSNSPLKLSLQAEKDFLELSKESYNCFEEEEKLTLGLDDMIMSLASNHEENVYLLQQALKTPTNTVATKESQKIINRIEKFKKISNKKEFKNNKIANNILINNIKKYAQAEASNVESPQDAQKLLLKVTSDFALIHELGGANVKLESSDPPFEYKCTISFVNPSKLTPELTSELESKVKEIIQKFENFTKEIAVVVVE